MRVIIQEAGVEYRLPSHKKITTPQDAATVSAELAQSATECFSVIYLNIRNGMLANEIITSGLLDCTPCHPREVFRSAITRNAFSIILVHNHPSGDTTPSHDDIRITKQLINSGEIIGIKVLDHIIVAPNTNFDPNSPITPIDGLNNPTKFLSMKDSEVCLDLSYSTYYK